MNNPGERLIWSRVLLIGSMDEMDCVMVDLKLSGLLQQHRVAFQNLFAAASSTCNDIAINSGESQYDDDDVEPHSNPRKRPTQDLLAVAWHATLYAN